MSTQEIENSGNLIDRIVHFFVVNEGQWHYFFWSSLKGKFILFFHFFRSTNKIMVFRKQSRSTHINTCHIPLLLPLCRSSLHEEPKTLSTQKHIDRLQHRTSHSEHHSSYWGEWVSACVDSNGNCFGMKEKPLTTCCAFVKSPWQNDNSPNGHHDSL